MRRILTFVAIMVILTCTMAFAGVFGAIKGFVQAEALSLLIGAGIGILGTFGISYKLWGVATKELGECIWDIYKATRPDSDGGGTVTKAEMTHIIQEASEIYPAVSAAIASHKAK